MVCLDSYYHIGEQAESTHVMEYAMSCIQSGGVVLDC